MKLSILKLFDYFKFALREDYSGRLPSSARRQQPINMTQNVGINQNLGRQDLK